MIRALCVTVLIASASVATAATLRVPLEHATIQAAIDASLPGDTVLVAPGVYRGEGNKNLDFNGRDIALIGELGSSSTIVDCEQSGRGIHLHSGESQSALVQGLTIRNGDQEGSSGGGFLLDSVSPRFFDVVVRECEASAGAGFVVYRGMPSFVGLRIMNCSTTGGSGGGGSIAEADVSFEDCWISDNAAYYGGALEAWSSTISMASSFVSGNSSSGHGGIYAANGSTLILTNVQITDNSSGWNDDGAGVYCSSSTGTFMNVRFEGNSAGWVGGALRLNNAEAVLIQNCLFVGNHSGVGAGALHADWSTATIENCTFLENDTSAPSEVGGVMASSWSDMTLRNCIVAFNTGGGVQVRDQASMEILCNDVFGNTGGDYLVIPDQTGLNGNISAGPGFCGEAAAAGQPYSLHDGSPCAPANNGCGVLMGAFPVGCTLTGIETGAADDASMSLIKSLY